MAKFIESVGKDTLKRLDYVGGLSMDCGRRFAR